jgi:sulfite exporter TauE/SafE
VGRVLSWVLLGVVLGAAGIAVLGALAFRFYRQVRQLGREVSAAGARIATITDEMQRAAPRR